MASSLSLNYRTPTHSHLKLSIQEEREMAKVLVVDDSRIQRRVLSAKLTSAGHTPIEAENGLEALKCIDANSPDFIVTDMHMPEMNGVELLRILKERKSEIPVIVVTAEIQVDVIEEVKMLGAKAFLIKPVKPEFIVQAVEFLLKSAS